MTRRFGWYCSTRVRHLVPRPDIRTRIVRPMYARRRTRPRGITILEVIVILVLILLAIAFLVPTRRHHGETYSRIKCASNLRQIGQAMLLYSNDNKGAYPRTIATTGAVVIPTWGTGATATDPFAAGGPAPNDVTAAFFLLLRTQDITSEIFVCPASDEVRWDFGGGTKTAADWSNWNGAAGITKHLSYSYQNPYANTGALPVGLYRLSHIMTSDLAMAADTNPGTKSKSNVMTVTTTSSAREMKGANSTNHEGDGQNVLYADGHVNFEQNPFVGVQRDNIYTTKSSSTAFSGGTMLNSPFNGSDSILLPTR